MKFFKEMMLYVYSFSLPISLGFAFSSLHTDSSNTALNIILWAGGFRLGTIIINWYGVFQAKQGWDKLDS